MVWWVAIAAAVAAVVKSQSDTASAEAEASGANAVERANAYAGNLIRATNNELKGQRASLARYTQSENNRRVLEGTGEAVTASRTNALRRQDAATAGDLENQIAFAEQAGGQAAAAAFSGLQGGVVDLVNGATAARRSRIEAATKEATKQVAYDEGQREKQIAQAGWDSLDHTDITTDIDYGHDIAMDRYVNDGLFKSVLAGFQAYTSSGGSLGQQGGSNYDAFADRAGSSRQGQYGPTYSVTGGR